LAWLGLAWLGLAWLGLAWLGLAWLGLAWLGLAWLFCCGTTSSYSLFLCFSVSVGCYVMATTELVATLVSQADIVGSTVYEKDAMCHTACQANANCEFWSWSKADSLCYTLRTLTGYLQNASSAADWRSGFKREHTVNHSF
jgi:hypothetical protein